MRKFHYLCICLRDVSPPTANFEQKMIVIKRLHRFVLKSFLPLFAMTFFICLFIVLMQFLWQHIDDLVGKGLDLGTLGELFFYAALSLVPMALPLAILLASLMTFGNLGEKFELTAMKASGISLLKVMRPLIVFLGFVAIGAFFFQNHTLPYSQTKMWTLLFSARQKTPELDIPEGAFYDQIDGYNLFVEKKDRKTGMLHDVMIYDVSRGFDNTSIIVADSGKMSVTEDKTHLFLQLFNGEAFENLRSQGSGIMENVPYRRESFSTKEILIAFDANFTRMDESAMRNQYVGKNITELLQTIDSVEVRVDSIGSIYANELRITQNMGIEPTRREYNGTTIVDVKNPDVRLERPLNVDSVFSAQGHGRKLSYLQQALIKATRSKQDCEFKALAMKDDMKTIRRHAIEMHKKFTLSLACLIFFFIGAPLGAIIRKGGLGAPMVISVILFIIYYIIDNTGYKMARDGRVEVWLGMWISSIVLFPLGAFFTYKAMNDSAVFNIDTYRNFFNRISGRRQKRVVPLKEVVIEPLKPDVCLEQIADINADIDSITQNIKLPLSYRDFWTSGIDRTTIKRIAAATEKTVDDLTNTSDKNILNRLWQLPVLRNLLLYQPSRQQWVFWTVSIIFPLGILGFLIGRRQQKQLFDDLNATQLKFNEIAGLLRGETLVAVPD